MASVVSDTLAVTLFQNPLYVMSHFSLLSDFSFCLWLLTVWIGCVWGRALCVFLDWSYWASWMCALMLFIKFGKFLPIIFSIIFYPFLSPPLVLLLCICWHSWWYLSGLFIFIPYFSFLRLDYLSWPMFNDFFSSTTQICLLNLFNEIFISVVYQFENLVPFYSFSAYQYFLVSGRLFSSFP